MNLSKNHRSFIWTLLYLIPVFAIFVLPVLQLWIPEFVYSIGITEEDFSSGVYSEVYYQFVSFCDELESFFGSGNWIFSMIWNLVPKIDGAPFLPYTAVRLLAGEQTIYILEFVYRTITFVPDYFVKNFERWF